MSRGFHFSFGICGWIAFSHHFIAVTPYWKQKLASAAIMPSIVGDRNKARGSVHNAFQRVKMHGVRSRILDRRLESFVGESGVNTRDWACRIWISHFFNEIFNFCLFSEILEFECSIQVSIAIIIIRKWTNLRGNWATDEGRFSCLVVVFYAVLLGTSNSA
jgi:hypothetical protein